MADWEDEEETGRGFGNGFDQCKDNDDGDYNGNGGDGDDGSRGFGNRRGRGGGRGRGGRGDRHGGGGGGYGGGGGGYGGGGRRNHDDNEDNAHQTELKSTLNSFVPNNFMRSTVQKFLTDVPSRVQSTNNLVEVYCIVKYLLKAYNIYLSAEMSNKDNYQIDATTAAGAMARDAACIEPEQEKFDIDQEYFNVIGGVEIDTSTNENIEMSDLIGDKSKAGSSEMIALSKDIDLATLQQSPISNLSELFKDAMEERNTTQPKQTVAATATPKPRTSRSKKDAVVQVVCERAAPQNARATAIQNIGPHITELEYALRKRLPMRNFLSIADNADAVTGQVRKVGFGFFPLVKTWANALTPNIESGVINRQPAMSSGADQSQIGEVSAGTSSSINVARQHISSTSVSGLPAFHLAHSESEGPSTNIFDDNFDTVQEIRDVLPQHTETAGMQAGNVIPELPHEDTFFTPDPIPIPSGMSSTRTDESKLKKVQLLQTTSGPSSSQRTDTLTSSRTVLPSIREEDFRRTLLRRTLRDTDLSSTPLRPLEGIVGQGLARATLQSDAPNDGSTELATVSDAPGQLETRGDIQAIVEVAEDLEMAVERQQPMQEQQQQQQHQPNSETIPNQIIMPTEASQSAATVATVESTTSNGRRDWFDVLRQRQVELRYMNVGPQRRRRRRHHLPRRRPPTATTEIVEHINEQPVVANIGILQAVSPLTPSQLPISGGSFGISEQAALLVERNLLEDVMPPVSTQVETTQRFVFEHIESISTIMDNLMEWQRMLKACNQEFGHTSATAFLPATYAYDVDTLVEADVQRLQLKLNILQEIIRNVTFDVTKTPLLRNKRLAATAFSFLIELKTAGIIRINENGRFVELL